MNERICTPPLEGLRRGWDHGGSDNERTNMHTPSGGPPEGRRTHKRKHTSHTLSRRSTTESPRAATPTSHHKKHRFPSPLPPASYDRWQYAWSTNCSTTPSASRGGPHRKRTHAGPCAALAHTPNRSWHSAAPSSPSSHDRGAAGIAARHRWHVACSGRSWSRCSRSSAAPTSRSARPHSPVPAPLSQPPALRSTSAPCATARPCETVLGPCRCRRRRSRKRRQPHPLRPAARPRQ